MTKDMEQEETLTAEQFSSAEPISYEARLLFASPISQPMASRKLTKKIYKLIKKAYKQKTHFWNGLKSVQQKLRKGGDGLVIIAGDVNPIDVISHLPGVCESKDIPYVYVPSREDIGTAMGVKRSVVTVFIAESPEYKKTYDTVLSEIKILPRPV